MIKLETIQLDSNHNISFLRDSLQDLKASSYKQNPGEGKWSIQQILEHLSMTEKLKLFNRNTKETSRDSNIIINQFRDYLGNRTVTVNAPTVVRPPGEDESKDVFLDRIEQSRLALIEEGQSEGWNHILEDIPHPISGTMTRLEWLYFNIYHVERHLLQIKEILQNPSIINT